MSTVDRAALDRGVQRPGQRDVDAVSRGAAHDVAQIDDRHGLPDIAMLSGRLQPQLVARRYRQVGGCRDQGTEAERAPTRPVHDRMIARLALADRHAPAQRGRRFEHLARRRAGLAHRRVEMPHAARAVRVLVAVARVAVRLLDLDSTPIGFELVRQHHW